MTQNDAEAVKAVTLGRNPVKVMTGIPERLQLLVGVVGSQAYGLAREGSDIDQLGVFVKPTSEFFQLGHMIEPKSVVVRDPDMTLHEIGKYCRLAAACNPTVLELMWLREYEVMSDFGARLVALRGAFLSEHRVRDAYGGYAKQQIERLIRREKEGKEGFSSDLRKRTDKHARHCFRLLHQGRELLESGELVVRIEDPSVYWELDGLPVAELARRFAVEDQKFRDGYSDLPSSPDIGRINEFLADVRKAFP